MPDVEFPHANTHHATSPRSLTEGAKKRKLLRIVYGTQTGTAKRFAGAIEYSLATLCGFEIDPKHCSEFCRVQDTAE